MTKFYLIRHFKTYGNTKRRYIGTTDEPLCLEGIEEQKKHRYADVEIVFSSPLKRCLETAARIYPSQKPIVIQKLSECDFGEFENKNAAELSDNPAYQEWIDSGGTLPFPGGESREEFINRSVDGFLEAAAICREKNISHAALVVHGGTIMSIMSHFLPEQGDYYHWQCRNGDVCELDF
ncbi:MAG: histidine phosphatase family protein [Lachnospiraceae bacterium]|nr:histidine phosphatase family protein [Lachnospiraceae bacterium]